MSNVVLAMMAPSGWGRPAPCRARSGGVGPAVDGEEGRIAVERGLLLPLSQGGVTEDGELDRTADPLVGGDDPGPDVELLRRDAQRLGQLLQHLGRRTAQAALDLAQVGVRHARLLGELPQREAGGDPLLVQVVTERLDGVADLPLSHTAILLAPASRKQTQRGCIRSHALEKPGKILMSETHTA